MIIVVSVGVYVKEKVNKISLNQQNELVCLNSIYLKSIRKIELSSLLQGFQALIKMKSNIERAKTNWQDYKQLDI